MLCNVPLKSPCIGGREDKTLLVKSAALPRVFLSHSFSDTAQCAAGCLWGAHGLWFTSLCRTHLRRGEEGQGPRGLISRRRNVNIVGSGKEYSCPGINPAHCAAPRPLQRLLWGACAPITRGPDTAEVQGTRPAARLPPSSARQPRSSRSPLVLAAFTRPSMETCPARLRPRWLLRFQ